MPPRVSLPLKNETNFVIGYSATDLMFPFSEKIGLQIILFHCFQSYQQITTVPEKSINIPKTIVGFRKYGGTPVFSIAF